MMNTTQVIERFNAAFVDHDSSLLAGLVGEDCVMVAVEPAPEGARYVGREACLAFWTALVDDRTSRFRPREVIVADDRATILWRFEYGDGPSDYVLGVNVMRVRDGEIVEAHGYSKTPGVGSPQLAGLVEAGGK